MKGIWKQLVLALVFALAVGMLPGMIPAASAKDYNLWLGSERVTSENLSGTGWRFSEGTNTLTLENYSYSGTGMNYGGAIYYQEEKGETPLTINLIGQNKVVNTEGSKVSAGIYIDESTKGWGANDVIITGNGSLYSEGVDGIYIYHGNLTIQNGSVEAKGTSIDGIVASTLTVTGGEFTATGGKGSLTDNSLSEISPCGILASYFKMSGGTVTATGGNTSKNNSYGLLAESTISGGTLTATGGNAPGSSIGIGGSLVDIQSGSVIAVGNTYGIGTTKNDKNNVKNTIAGTGWTDKDGTTGKTSIAANTEVHSLIAFKKVQFPAASDPKHSVTLTGGANAAVSGGSTTQSNLTGAMTTVTYTANSGYHFAEFTDIANNGITAKRTSETVVTVSGTPTGDASLTVPDAVSNPTVKASASGYAGLYDGQPHGITVSVTDPSSGATVIYGTQAGTYDKGTSPTITEVGSLKVYYQVTAPGYMPLTGSETVTITADTTIYNVEVTAEGNGKAEADPTSGLTGTKVTLTAVPEEGQFLSEWEVESGNVRWVDDNSFLISGSDVQIKAIFEEIKPYPARIEHIDNKGNRGFPEDLDENQTFTLTVTIQDGAKTYTAKQTFNTTDLLTQENKQKTAFEFSFPGKIPDKFTTAMTRKVKVEPSSVTGSEEIYNTDKRVNEKIEHQYNLEAATPSIDPADEETLVITLYWREVQDSDSDGDEIAVYALPEDEIGSYWLHQDGTKEYLLFHTYGICMNYLGSAELCRGYERCYHKDGK